MSYKFQRKTIRFRKSRNLEITVGGVATPILTAALADTPVLLDAQANLPANKAAFVAIFTGLTYEAAAITELGKMWDVAARCAQCLTDNGLATYEA